MGLEGFNFYNQFVLWKKTERGKVPCDQQGTPIDSHNPANWMPYIDACNLATSTGLGIGFVFTANDPFFFLDIDHCAVNGQWSQLALDICAMLPGAGIEISSSGTGLHLFGSYSQIFAHSCKNTQLGIELYNEGRFCALTYNAADGNVNTDCTQNIQLVIDKYFPLGTTAPNEFQAWSNSSLGKALDDSALLEKALNTKSNQSWFTGKATFSDLFLANINVLATSYPALNDKDAYDKSSADAALAQMLAFWTGNNCEQMARIMNMSALKREKWVERDDYIKRTILNACSGQQQFYGENIPQSRSEIALNDLTYNISQPQNNAPCAPQVTINATVEPGAAIMAATQQQEYFAGCVYIRSIHAALTPGGKIMKPEVFKVSFGGYDFIMDNEGKGSKNAWEAFTESRINRFPKVDDTCFRPDLAPGTIVHEENRDTVNVYFPIATPMMNGDISPFMNHLNKMLPVKSDADILLAYMAALLQYPGVKFQWAPLLQGCQGNGKSLFTRCLEFAVGKTYSHSPNSGDLGSNGSKFNQWIENKILIILEEIYVGDRREVADALKPLITNDRIEIQGKGKDQVTKDNRANFILCSNHKDAVRLTNDDRRYCIFYTAQQSYEDIKESGFDGDYFPNLYDWLRREGYQIVNYFLRNYAIPDALNPATLCNRAPKTSSTKDALTMSLGFIEQEILDAIDQERPGFVGGWISQVAVKELIKEVRGKVTISKVKLEEILAEMGYIKHPTLKNGLTPKAVAPDLKRTTLWVKRGHLSLNITDRTLVADQYQIDQPSTSTFGGSNVKRGN